MPVYEYACQRCDHHFDVRYGADEVPTLSCPKCHSEVKKVFHAAGIIFKGSGWHITDYAPKGSVPSESKAESGEKTESKETKASTESTPALSTN